MPKRHYRNLRNKAKPWKEEAAKRMAKNLTAGEKVLWDELKNKSLGVCIHKQKVILGYIVDFWCPSAGLVIEVDGPHHRKASQKRWDKTRDLALKRKKISTLRFSSSEIRKNLPAVIAIIRARVRSRMK